MLIKMTKSVTIITQNIIAQELNVVRFIVSLFKHTSTTERCKTNFNLK